MDKQNIKQNLLSYGFDENLINKALLLTNDEEQAVELILQFQEDNQQNPPQNLQNTDLLGGLNPNQFIQAAQNNNLQQQQEDNDDDYEDEEESSEYYKMVFLVRADLKMNIGKIALQTGDATLGAYQKLESQQSNPDIMKIINYYEQSGTPKIVLKVNSKEQLIDIEQKAVQAGINTYCAVDEQNNMTVCAIGPAQADTIDSVSGHLKLL